MNQTLWNFMKCLLQKQSLSHVKRIAIKISDQINILIQTYNPYFQIEFGDTDICWNFCHFIIIICLRDAYWCFNSFTNSSNSTSQLCVCLFKCFTSHVHSSHLSWSAPFHVNINDVKLQHCFYVDDFKAINQWIICWRYSLSLSHFHTNLRVCVVRGWHEERQMGEISLELPLIFLFVHWWTVNRLLDASRTLSSN